MNNQIDDCEELDIPTFDNEIEDDITSHNGEWVNHTSKPLKKIKCIIDYSIVEKVRDLQYCVDKKFATSNEFGGYVKWHWDNKGNVVVDDFMIPEQVVGGATVDFKSEATPGYTGVFHKHPNGIKSFSSVDDNYINSNHDLSILFEGGNFVTGIINIPLPNGMRYQTTLQIVVNKHELRKEVNVDMISCHNQRNMFRQGKSAFQEQVRIAPPHLSGFNKSIRGMDFTKYTSGNDIIDDEDDDIPQFTI